MKSNLEIHREARLRIKLEDRVRLNPVFRTLFYGLKRNHPHNGAVIHPLAYLIRRILFACAIVFLAHANVGQFGAIALLLTALFMLCFAAAESQWEDKPIRVQHILNECVFYLFCIVLICFPGSLMSPLSCFNAAFMLIGLFVVFVLYNVGFILYQMIQFLRLLKRRFWHKFYSKKVPVKADKPSKNKVLSQKKTPTKPQEEQLLK